MEAPPPSCTPALLAACHSRLLQETQQSFFPCTSASTVWLFGYASLIWNPSVAFTASTEAALGGWKRVLRQGSPDHRGTAARLGRVATLAPCCPSKWRQAPPASSAAQSPPSSAAALSEQALQLWLASGQQQQQQQQGAAAESPEEHKEEEDEEEEEPEASADVPVVHGMAFLLAQDSAEAMLAKLCKREQAGYSAVRVQLATPLGPICAVTFVAHRGNEFWSRDSELGLAQAIAAAAGESGKNFDYFLQLLSAMRSRGVLDQHLERLAAHLLRAEPVLLGEQERALLQALPAAAAS
jgi:cation transport regulator ChaC